MNGPQHLDFLNCRTALPPSRDLGVIHPISVSEERAFASDEELGLPLSLWRWAHTPAGIGWPGGASYQYRLGSHRLILAFPGESRRGDWEEVVGRAEVEFSIVEEGPLMVFGFRFFETSPWAWAAPYNWHFAPPSERVVPASVPLTPKTYARFWATLWITLDGTSMVRAVTLRPEFTHTLNAVLREQALRPFRVEAAERALDRLRYATIPLDRRSLVTTRSASVSDPGGRWASTRSG